MSKKEKNIGKVYLAETKYIDKDTKNIRRYVVVKDNGENVAVSKLKSIKKFDSDNKNSDPYLIEINSSYPGLSKRTGVDEQVFNRNRLTKKKLSISKDNGVFNNKEEFKLSSHDTHRVLKHVKLRTGKKHKKSGKH